MENNERDIDLKPHVEDISLRFEERMLRVWVRYNIEGLDPSNWREYRKAEVRVVENLTVRFIDPKTKEILGETKNVYDVPAILEFDEPPSELKIEVTHKDQRIFSEYLDLESLLKQ